LGSYVLNNVITHLTTNSGLNDFFNGIIGGEILHRFNVVFDYEREQLLLKPNAHLQEPFEYDMSGLSLAACGSGLA